MKKLLLITLIIPFISLVQAQEDTQNDSKRNLCVGKAYKILKKGLAPCKAGDTFLHAEVFRRDKQFEHMLRICVRGTISGDTCILRAQEDWLDKRVKH